MLSTGLLPTRHSVQITAIRLSTAGFAVRYVLARSIAPGRTPREYEAVLPLPLPSGADRWLTRTGDTCTLTIVGDKIVEVGA